MYKILLVDDDPHILASNETYLKKHGYDTATAADGLAALQLCSTAAFDAVIMDVDMPGMDGVSVCRRLREVSSVPIIFLSAYARTDNRIRGLMAGGDDYVGKPYSLTELELRLRLRIQRHKNIEASEVLRFGGLEVDMGLREARFEGHTAPLTALEFDLLAFLARNPTRCSPMSSCTTGSGSPQSTRVFTTSRSAWPACDRSWMPSAPVCTGSRRCGERATASTAAQRWINKKISPPTLRRATESPGQESPGRELFISSF